jgi:hypothetical protein
VARRILVDPTVAAIVGSGLDDIVAQQRTTPIVCDRCGADVGLDEPASMLAYSDAIAGRTLIRFAHEQCSDSLVLERALDGPLQIDARWRAYLRPRQNIAGFLLWEPIGTLTHLDGGDPIAARLRELGFEPVTQTLDALNPVVIDDAVLDFAEPDALRLVASGAQLMSFDALSRRDPEATWRASLHQSGACAVLYADGLGLGTPSKTQLDQRLKSAPYPLAATLRVEQLEL